MMMIELLLRAILFFGIGWWLAYGLMHLAKCHLKDFRKKKDESNIS
tara:strand:- start:1095 stop:1232 length:138 start_codon:yes stop_codon:yes gene_type:complete